MLSQTARDVLRHAACTFVAAAFALSPTFPPSFELLDFDASFPLDFLSTSFPRKRQLSQWGLARVGNVVAMLTSESASEATE
eukprot:CAMPEP_0185523264 /NCGR_PEP_ID=MMETSP1366-20130426/84912_1 /TAXON_ID=38817 /ORGANISM="Gephyrocapsa oceanica, Strain RCC1303" /LENGTH=81 /DNA_ID=CAMNT_0028134553 /DNA_START=122 /DNA_END=364 /DNA_ORIENTATION=-